MATHTEQGRERKCCVCACVYVVCCGANFRLSFLLKKDDGQSTEQSFHSNAARLLGNSREGATRGRREAEEERDEERESVYRRSRRAEQMNLQRGAHVSLPHSFVRLVLFLMLSLSLARTLIELPLSTPPVTHTPKPTGSVLSWRTHKKKREWKKEEKERKRMKEEETDQAQLIVKEDRQRGVCVCVVVVMCSLTPAPLCLSISSFLLFLNCFHSKRTHNALCTHRRCTPLCVLASD